MCADLLLKGYSVYLTDQGIPYDIIVDTGDNLYRVQVKSTQLPRKPNKSYHSTSYKFHVRRCGKGGNKTYTWGEFDIWAFIALDTKQIAYMIHKEELNKTLIFRDRRQTYRANCAHNALYIDDPILTIENAIKDVDEK